VNRRLLHVVRMTTDIPDDAATTPARQGRATRRATAARRRGRSRATQIATRVGIGLRDARLARGLRQVDVAREAGISQPFYSRIEHGRELGVSLLTLCACASSLGVQLAGFVEALPGSSLPRDIEHLRRQSLVVGIAAHGGWRAAPESPLVDDGPRPRSIDVRLTRPERHEAAVVEVWDLLADGGDAMRGLDAKVLATRERLGAGWRVEGLLLLRRTARNRAVVRELRPLIAARFPARSTAWLAALTRPDRPMPAAPGFAWTSVAGDLLVAARL
jgi:transcriptional regulator with XRE-family HTH domain